MFLARSKPANLERAPAPPNSPAPAFAGLIGGSAAMRAVFEAARQLAAALSVALITGPKGSGKQTLARAIHGHGASAQRRFVVFDAREARNADVAAHLFGRLRGGARRIGLLEYAGGGTVFLNEVSAIPLAVQEQLAQAMIAGEFKPQGSPAAHPLRASVVAGSSVDLDAGAASQRFSAELYKRFSVFHIRLPALAERREDIPELAQHFIRLFARSTGKELRGATVSALDALQSYQWPGNVRELEDAIASAVHVADGPWIEGRHLPREITEPMARIARAEWEPLPLDTVRRDHIERVLKICGGNRIRAARMLGIGRTSLYRFLKRSGHTNPGRSGGRL